MLLGILPALLPAQHLFEDPGGRRHRTYDVIHYRLAINFDEPAEKVMGVAEISLRPLDESLGSVWFHAANMEVSAVRLSDGTPLVFDNDNSFITVTLDRNYSNADTVTVNITYSCFPQQGLYFIRPDSNDLTKRSQIWTQGEEIENRHWFPCYDFPDDKATSELIATVRDSYTVLSNGKLMSEVHDTASGTRTFHWSQTLPHSSYLIMLAAGEYSVVTSVYGHIPLPNYVYPADTGNVRHVFGKTREMMRFFEALLNRPYPWEQYAHIIIDQFMWGGMENTSAVTLNESYMFGKRDTLDANADGVIAHELAHQWWGDLVTCSDWTHLWLNEGFANYYESLFRRYDRGQDEFQHEAYLSSRSVRNQEGRLGRKPIVSVESYGINLYDKGAWVLRMLNDILGKDEFTDAIRFYLDRYQFRNASTHDFEMTVEEFTGQDLGWFFSQWVYKAGHPKLEVETEWDGSGLPLRVRVQQTQETDSLTGLFRFPLEIATYGPGGWDLHRVWVEHEEEEFVFPVDERPDLILIDPDLKVLKSFHQQKSLDELTLQLEVAPSVPSRLEALEGLGEMTDERKAFESIRWVALHDPFWGVRRAAVRLLGDMEFEEDAREALLEACKDGDARVRASAVDGLEMFRSPGVAQALRSVAVRDSSNQVVATCVRVMPSLDSLVAFDMASRFVTLDSRGDAVRRSSLNAMRTLGIPASLPFGMKYSGPEYILPTRLSALGIIRETGKDDPGARGLIARLVSHPSRDIRLSAVRTLGHWGGSENYRLLEDRCSLEEDKAVLEQIEEALADMSRD
jgi:aminopeptidase N